MFSIKVVDKFDKSVITSYSNDLAPVIGDKLMTSDSEIWLVTDRILNPENSNHSVIIVVEKLI